MLKTTTTLSKFLKATRERLGLSLRSVEQATGVSNAYLSQLENGHIKQPSPVLLHRLSELYRVPYAEILRMAGYPLPHGQETSASVRSFSRLSDVTAEEEKALTEYLEFLRARRPVK